AGGRQPIPAPHRRPGPPGRPGGPAPPGRVPWGVAPGVSLPIPDLQPQFAAYLGTPTRARGYPPYAGQHALIVEVAPGLAIERVMDLALKADPELEPGILFVERQFGILEIHGSDKEKLLAAGRAVLAGLKLTE